MLDKNAGVARRAGRQQGTRRACAPAASALASGNPASERVIQLGLPVQWAGVRWTSGALFSDLDAAGMREKREAKNKGELARLSALKSNESLPLVYFDIELKGERLGRILFVLFTDTSPR